MLDTIFLQIFDMTKVASLVILIVLLVRLCLKRTPKVISYVLWAVVLFRLLCPVSIEAPISLIPQTEPTIQSYDLLNEPVTPLAAIDAAGQAVGDVLNGGIGIQHVTTTNYLEDGTRRIISTDWNTVWILFTKFVWLGGMAALLIYSTVSLIRLKRKLIGAILLRDNIYLADHIDSPFVMGLFRPKIYLPSSLSEKERDYIILHEQYHIRRGDHVVKLLSFTALCLHCFNPLVWIAFILSGKDMEMSCDEAVLRNLGDDIRADYTASLISLATGRRIIAGTPLAFGEGNTEGRIKNIAKWKKPAVWVIVIVAIVCAFLAVCLITNPMNRDTMLLGAEYRIEEILYRTSEEYIHEDNDSPSICITADYCLWERNPDGEEWELIGQMEPYTLDKKELAEYTAYDAGWVRRYNTGEITDSYILHLSEDEYTGMLYIAFRTKNGDTLLGYGWEDLSERGQGPSDDTSFQWLCRLESTFDHHGRTGMFLDRSLAASVGGDVDSFHTWSHAYKPGYIIVAFDSDDSAYSDGWLVPSPEKTDMGFAVFYHNKDESGYRLLQCHVYEDAALAENGIYLCPDPAVLDLGGKKKPDMTYDVILLNNEKIEKATRVWEYADGETETDSAGYLNGHEMVLFSWENDKPGSRVWQYFYDEHDELIDYSSIPIKEIDSLSSQEENKVYTVIDNENIYQSDKTWDQPLGFDVYHITIHNTSDETLYYTVRGGSDDYSGSVKADSVYTFSKTDAPHDKHTISFSSPSDTLSGTISVKIAKYAVNMIPTTANITGAFDGYLYVPINGANYRYEIIFDDPTSVTPGKLMYQFTEKADPFDVEWRVYAVDDYPDRSVVLAEAGDDYVHLYRYSPSKAVDPALLEQAKEDGKIVLENGYATSGQALWNTFYKLAGEGKHISADIVHYYTMENGNYDGKYYEAYKEDYPAMYEFELIHDGGIYTMKWNEYGTEYVRTYKYLRKFETTIPTPQSAKEPMRVTKYVLTNDADATLDELWHGVASSQLGDYIDFYTIYSVKN